MATMMYLIAFGASSLVTAAERNVNDHNDTFAIVTDGCIIPSAPGAGPLLEQMTRTLPKENCYQNNLLLESNSTHVWIISDVFDSYNIMDVKEFYCCYKNFFAHKNIHNIIFGNCVMFKTAIKALHEFVRVECFYLDSVIYTDYFVFTVDEIKPKRPINESAFNVIILGMEGISRLNFDRMMPKTAKYLSDRGAVQLRGYNKVGDNSFPNLFPLLTGRSFKSCKGGTCGMIWQMFKNAGFYTALGADSAAGVLADYELRWPTLPTDYYLQPFMNEATNIFKNPQFVYEHQCLRNKLFYKIMLNYIKGLMETLKYNRIFGFFWEESISHDLINNPQLMDEGYLKFAEELEENGKLDNTILIFLSDHGMRWGKFVETRQGHLEARLPILTILFPSSFKKTYKYAFNNFMVNSNRLTTPYDMYWTLVDLVNPSSLTKSRLRQRVQSGSFNEKQEKWKRMSLFLPVSGSRTCAGLGIAPAWCTCNAGVALPAGARAAAAAARVLVSYINELLSKYSQCLKLHIEELVAVTVVKDARGSGRTYAATVRTAPGGALLEGLVRRERARWAAGPHVTRLNAYRNQSHCVESQTIKLYCFCAR